MNKAPRIIEWSGFTHNVSRVDPFLQPWKNVTMSAWKKDGPDVIVFHWTGGSTLKSAINTLFGNGLAYHFFIEKDGTIIQSSPINKRASHAGKSWGPRGNTYSTHGGLNEYGIGISFVYTPVGNSELISDAQMLSAKQLVILLQANFTSIKYITTHFEITPARKGDIYFWGSGYKQRFGNSMVNEINTEIGNKALTWWECGDDWIDKNETKQTFKYACDNNLGGFDSYGKRNDGKGWGILSYTRTTRNEKQILYHKDWSSRTTIANSYIPDDVSRQ